MHVGLNSDGFGQSNHAENRGNYEVCADCLHSLQREFSDTAVEVAP